MGRYVFFFFQAEDGIRDYKVTGVQTCALPICNQSNSEYIKQRKLTYGHYRENPKKSHIANLNTYGFRREKLLAILSDTPNVNTLNFAQVAREISLVRDDKLPGNSSQVSLLRNCFLLQLLQCITICTYPLISLCLGCR